MKDVKINPVVLETLKLFAGKPRRVDDVVKESGIDRENVLNHLRSGRQSGLDVQHIGPLNCRYFYVPSASMVNIKETITSQVLEIFQANPGEEFTVNEFCDMLEADKSHIHSIISLARKKGTLNILSRNTPGQLQRKVYWFEPKQQELDLGET